MKINKIVFFLLLSLSNFAFATLQLDVYGVDDQMAKKILETCRSDLEKYHEAEFKYMESSILKRPFIYRQLRTLYKKIVTDINHFGDYKLIKFATTVYPNQTRYMTVNIVQTKDSYRMPEILPRAVDKTLTLDKETEEVFKLYTEYNRSNYKFLMNGTLNSLEKICPAPHCIWNGFTKEELARYYPKLRNFANDHASTLKKIIHSSEDEDERGDAIIILGHADSYQEISKFLLNYLEDESPIIRNNAMRILGEVSLKHRIDNLPLKTLLQKLVSPYDGERNKAAIILYNIVSQDATTHKQILQKSGSTLVNLLKLQQPNNHDLAYQILKKISHKNYAERDYQSWEQWIKRQHV